MLSEHTLGIRFILERDSDEIISGPSDSGNVDDVPNNINPSAWDSVDGVRPLFDEIRRRLLIPIGIIGNRVHVREE